MKTLDERIANLESRLTQEKAKKQKRDARLRAAESKISRSLDTRKKILVGAAILARVERKQMPLSELIDLLDSTLTRPDDRALFDLPLKSALPATSATPALD